MPDVVGAIVATGKYIIAAFSAAAAGTATTAQLLTVIAVQTAASVGLSALTRPRQQGQSFEDPGLQLQPQRGGTIPRTIVYGETLTAGHIVYINSTGQDNKFLDMIIAIGDGGPYESIEAVYFDEEELTLDGSGNVTSPSKYDGFATIITTLGSESQSAISQAVSNITAWTTNHAGKGICHAYVRLTYDAEVWTQGLPTIRFKVRGRKVYDPRLDSTNGGTGSHRKDDATTWEFSQNKALWLLDWMRGVDMNSQRIAGFDVSDTLIDWGAFADAADVCDENVDVDGGGTINRYTGGGGTVSSADDPKSVADIFIRCMAGEWAPRSGYIGVYAGASRTAAVTLTDDDLAGPIKLKTAKSIRETVNRLQATYRDPDEAYEMTDAPPYINASWESDDGEVLESETTLPFIDDHRQAQRICKLLAGRLREPRELTATFKQKAMQVLEGDAFTWSSERFPASVEGKYIVTNRTIFSDGTVQITARSETTGFYTWDEATEETARTVTNPINATNPLFGLEVLSPADFRRTLLADLPTPTLRLDFVDSDYDANLGGSLTYKDTASWNDDVDDRPVELTDGRVGNGLAVNGDIARAIPEPIKTSSDILSRSGGGTYTGDLAATLGADWSANVGNKPANLDSLTGTEDILNGDIVIAADGTLTGAGGGQVTISGLGYTGDLDATAGADWATNLANPPAELTDGRVSTAIATGGKVLVDGYEVNKFFSGSPSALTSITDANATGIVLARVDLDDARAINLWSLLGTDIVFGTHQTGTMGSGETANFELEVWYTNPDASPVALGGNFGSVGVTAYQVATSGALDWSIILSDTGSITIKSEIISGNPTITNDELNDEIGLQNIKFPSAALGAAHVYLVGRWIGTDSASSTGIALRFTTDTTLAVTNLINRSTS
jgi:hypothetical protein